MKPMTFLILVFAAKRAQKVNMLGLKPVTFLILVFAAKRVQKEYARSETCDITYSRVSIVLSKCHRFHHLRGRVREKPLETSFAANTRMRNVTGFTT